MPPPVIPVSSLELCLMTPPVTPVSSLELCRMPPPVIPVSSLELCRMPPPVIPVSSLELCRMPPPVIQLTTVRSIATTDNSFRMEIGRNCPTGEGELNFLVEDAALAREMHGVLLEYMTALEASRKALSSQAAPRRRTDSHTSPGRRAEQQHQRPQSCYPVSVSWQSPTSPLNPADLLPQVRQRTNTGESRYWEDKMEVTLPYVETEPSADMGISIVPEDMTPPSSPNHLDEQMKEYLEMDNSKNSHMTTSISQDSSYMQMVSTSHTQKDPPVSSCQQGSAQTVPDTYMTMGSSTQPPGYASSHVPAAGSSSHIPSQHAASTVPPTVHHGTAPIQMHSFSESHHSTLPTVREGGSNEGYFPMEIVSSPASSTGGILRPEPAKCMLLDDTTGLPPRTYSLGSRPVSKKDTGYMEMGPRGGSNDMSRATSAPHIINKTRKEKEHYTESPSQSASPLSASFKSDDSDSFMEYMPMRPRTASDSFNYRPRTSSFGKLQPMSRPRSSSHGQGTRPYNKFSKLMVEQSRISLDPQQRVSQESSLQGSFESLRVSSESLRKTGHDIRKKTGSNASDYAEMRGTPSPQLKSEADPGYMSMQLGAAHRRTSPHRVRSDSNSSGRRPDTKSACSDRTIQQQLNLQESNVYTEMAPLNAAHSSGGDPYMNMECGQLQRGGVVDKRPVSGSSSVLQPQADSAYLNMAPENSRPHTETGRSVSVENVDTYILYDPVQPTSDKMRTASVGAKDKKPRPARKSSSVSVSSSSPTSSGTFMPQAAVSSSARVGSSDSIRKASRQSSMEKNASLGKDFRKKSGSMGSRPVKVSFLEKEHQTPLSLSAPQRKPLDDNDDEYIEFSPTVTLGEGDASYRKSQALHHPGQLPYVAQHSSGVNHQPGCAEDEAYTEYNPALPPISKNTKSLRLPSVKVINPPSVVLTAKQISAKDVPEYVGFEPGVIMPVPVSSHLAQEDYVGYQPGTLTKGRGGHQPGARLQQNYVGYQPGTVSAPVCTGFQPEAAAALAHDYISYQPSLTPAQDYIGYQPGSVTQRGAAAKDYPSSQPKVTSAFPFYPLPQAQKQQEVKLENQEYIGFEPGKNMSQTYKSPCAAISYIQNPVSVDKLTQKQSLVQPHCSSQSDKPVNSKSTMDTLVSQLSSHFLVNPEKSTPEAYLPQNLCESKFPPETNKQFCDNVWPRSSSGCVPSNTQSPSLCEPQSFCTAQQVVTEAQPCTALQSVTGVQAQTDKPNISQQTPKSTADDNNQYLSFSPAGSVRSPSEAQKGSVSSARGVCLLNEPKLTELKVDVSGGGGAMQSPVNRTQVERQLSANDTPSPSCSSYPSSPAHPQTTKSCDPAAVPPDSQPSPECLNNNKQILSPQPPCCMDNNKRHKHMSGPEVTSPVSQSSRQKHPSGSSQKNRKTSSDTEKPFGKVSRSEVGSNSDPSSSGKSRRRMPSGDKVLCSSSEKIPLSPARSGGVEFFCGEASPTSGKALEAKMAVVEAKIRYSVGDVTALMSTVNKDSHVLSLGDMTTAINRDGHGLIRPGSSPCMQNLESSQDPCGRSSGSDPTPTSSLHSRARHSIPDLGFFQQVVCGPEGKTNSNSGSGDSCGSEPALKPLNYVSLDLGISEGQGDADCKMMRSKSRNSSDADERQPPLSYAEIDFVSVPSRLIAVSRHGSLQCPVTAHCSVPSWLIAVSQHGSLQCPIMAHCSIPARLIAVSRHGSLQCPITAHCSVPARLIAVSQHGSLQCPSTAHCSVPAWLI
ncbi:hypothetical protein Btru_039545 [Bulinus truncatus]|nr:hypothetical protein Btru_039545 [Bulinus truncatus]